LENFLLLIIIGILLLYFFSSANVYKSLYKKVNEEKNLVETELKKLEGIVNRYEKQVKVSATTLKSNHNNLQVARDDLQQLRLENMNQKHQIEELDKRNEELYAQVNTMV
jgi:predicted metalloprotease